MKPKKLNLKLLWIQFADFLYPRLRFSLIDRAVYFYLLRHTRLEGRLQLHCSMPWIARGLGISTGPVRESVRRLSVLGALRVVQRSKAGHILEVRLPEEIPAAPPVVGDLASSVASAEPNSCLNPDTLLNLQELDFLKTRALRQSIHLRERGHCFYCLQRTDARNQCLDHVVPRVKAGANSYRNLVSCCLECNSQKGERSAADFLRSLYRDRRLTAAELNTRLRVLDALASGRLPPPVQHPDTPVGTPYRSGILGVGALAPTSKARRTKSLISSDVRPASSSHAFRAMKSSSSHATRDSFLGRKGRPPGSRSGL